MAGGDEEEEGGGWWDTARRAAGVAEWIVRAPTVPMNYASGLVTDAAQRATGFGEAGTRAEAVDDLQAVLVSNYETINRSREDDAQESALANVENIDHTLLSTADINAASLNDVVQDLAGVIAEIDAKEEPLSKEDKIRREKAQESQALIEDYLKDEEPEVGTNLNPFVDPSAEAAEAQHLANAAASSAGNFDIDEAQAAATAYANASAEEGFNIVHGASQCFLLYNMSAFAQQHRALLAGSEPPIGAYVLLAGQEIKTPGYYSNKISAPRIYLIDEKTDGSEIISRLRIKKGSDHFVKLKVHEHAHLSPLLKIYKVFRNSNNTGESAMVEVKFDKTTNLDGIAQALTVDHPRTDAKGSWPHAQFSKGSGVGIKSFDWTFLGTDPFTATRDISATLKLVFQDFSSLLAVHRGPDLYADNSNTTKEYKYLDLIVQPDCRDDRENILGQVYSPECYEVRVDIGYHEVDATTVRPDTRQAIKYQRESLYLIPNEHEIEFADDGHVEVTIKLRGRLESLMSDKKFNVLLPGGGFLSGPAADAYGLQTLDGFDRVITRVKEKKDPTETDKKSAKKAEAAKAQFFAIQKQVIVGGILTRLENAGMVFMHTVGKEDWEEFLSWQTKPPEGGTLILPEKIDYIDADTFGKGTIDDALKNKAGTGATLEAIIKEHQKTFKKAYERKDRVINYIFLGDLLATVLGSVMGEVFFLAKGDLGSVKYEQWIASWTETLADVSVDLDIEPRVSTMHPGTTGASTLEEVRKKFKILLGNISVDFLTEDGSKTETINLAHIPISIASYYKFMVDNVLTKDRMHYSLFAFINDLLSDLVTGMLGADCFGGLIDAPAKALTNTIVVNEPFKPSFYTIGGETPGAGPPSFDVPYKTLHLENTTTDNPVFERTPVHEGLTQQKPMTYLAISALSFKPKNLRGNAGNDKNRGISHFTFGAPEGLLKSVKFNKTDQEFLPEARYANEGDFVFNQLSNVYDASFNMVGNTLFAPGQYIYLDASSLGAGHSYHYKELSGGTKERSWANIMGLGGYHIVTEVANSIAPGTYNTTIKARWETGGKMEDQGSTGDGTQSPAEDSTE